MKRGRKSKALSATEKAAIQRVYRVSKSKSKTAKSLGLSVYQVNKAVGKKTRGKAGVKFGDVPQGKINTVLRKYNDKISKARIAKEEGLTPYMVNKLIKEHNY